MAFTSPVAIAEVREPPDVTQTHGITDAGQQKLGVVGPVAAFLVLVSVLLDRHDGAGRGGPAPRGRVGGKAGVPMREGLETLCMEEQEQVSRINYHSAHTIHHNV